MADILFRAIHVTQSHLPAITTSFDPSLWRGSIDFQAFNGQYEAETVFFSPIIVILIDHLSQDT